MDLSTQELVRQRDEARRELVVVEQERDDLNLRLERALVELSTVKDRGRS